jgi:hypothetical protein
MPRPFYTSYAWKAQKVPISVGFTNSLLRKRISPMPAPDTRFCKAIRDQFPEHFPATKATAVAAEVAIRTLDERKQEYLYGKQLDFLLGQATPELLGPGCVLVCDSEEQAKAFRPLLDAKGLSHVDTCVAAPLPTSRNLAKAGRKAIR